MSFGINEGYNDSMKSSNTFCVENLLACKQPELKTNTRKANDPHWRSSPKEMNRSTEEDKLTESEDEIVSYVKELEASQGVSRENSSFHSQESQFENSTVLHRNIKIDLLDSSMWKCFNQEYNEMIVTKSGRRMFPVVRVSVTGLEKDEIYKITIDFVPRCQNKWKYVNRQWSIMSRNSTAKISSEYEHPDSPNTGEHWDQSAISFSKVKISNKPANDKINKIELSSLCQYWPRVNIYQKFQNGFAKVAEKIFDCTKFIAVTAYQNDKITSMKILYNPFAKAFQDYRSRDREFEDRENMKYRWDRYQKMHSWYHGTHHQIGARSQLNASSEYFDSPHSYHHAPYHPHSVPSFHNQNENMNSYYCQERSFHSSHIHNPYMSNSGNNSDAMYSRHVERSPPLLLHSNSYRRNQF